MSEPNAETGGNPGSAGADAGSSFLATLGSEAGTTAPAPTAAPDTTTAAGVQQAIIDGPPEIEPGIRVPEKFWDAEAKQVKTNDVVKAYTNLEKLVGRDKVVMPTGDDDEEGWERVNAAFRPEAPDKYDFGEQPKDMPAGLSYDVELEESFRNAAFANGIAPRAAKGLHDMFVKAQVERVTQYNKMMAENKTQLSHALQREHGPQFQAVLNRTKTIMDKYADPDFKQFLDETGNGNDPRMIRMLDRIGRDMAGETKLIGSPQATASHADIDAAISQFSAKNQKALFDKTHPDHNRLVAERAKLFEAKYGDAPA